MLAEADRTTLLDVAVASIRHGLTHGAPLGVAAADFSPSLQTIRATFVTLSHGERLRGCIGNLEAERALVVDTDFHTFAAAFRDPRFPPLRAEELTGLAVRVSILSPPEPIAADSEEELIARLRPEVDGVILQEGRLRATFLPSVWHSLPEPRQFLAALKRKAGLPAHHWSERIRLFRYTAESLGRTLDATASGCS